MVRFILPLILMSLIFSAPGAAQICGPGTPSFTVDLRGNPDSTWTSSPTARADTCCGVTGSEVCIEFIITLDSLAHGIRLDLIDGALPSGALYYKLNCGPQVPIGTELCFTTPGPHSVTFCKPGNNTNTYQIRSIGKPKASGDIIVSEGCTGILGAAGFDASTITWKSATNDSLLNSFLSCRSSCDTVTVQAQPGYPPFADYVVCGMPNNACQYNTVCDTVRVQFVSDLAVDILPDSPAVCFGMNSATLEAQVSGGLPPYVYDWSTGESTAIIQSGSGWRTVSITDQTSCGQVVDSVFVDSFSVPIDAQAGVDTLVCAMNKQVELQGVVAAALGGYWKGGAGTFSGGRTNLTATYTPTAQELATGFVDLELVTTGNLGCPGDSDIVRITYSNTPVATLSGPATACAPERANYIVQTDPTNTTFWQVNGGARMGTSTSDTITVDWNNAGSASVWATVSNSAGCDTLMKQPVQVNVLPQPSISGATTTCAYDQALVYTSAGSGTFVWSVAGGQIRQGAGTKTIEVDWGAAGAGFVAVALADPATGCTAYDSLPVTIQPTPNPNVSLSGATHVCAPATEVYTLQNGTGYSYQWQVQGGIISGSSTGSNLSVNWSNAAAGSVSVTVIHPSGCDTVLTLPVQVDLLPQPSVSGAATACAYDPMVTYTSSGAGTFIWSVVGGHIRQGSGTNSISVDWSGPGQHDVAITLSDPASGCTAYDTLPVTVNPSPNANVVLSGRRKICAPLQAHYEVQSGAGYSFQWQVNGGTVLGSTTNSAVNVQWSNAGTGAVSVLIKTPQGCDTTLTLPVQVDIAPNPVISGSAGICAFTSGVTYNVSGAGNFAWSVSGGQIVQGNGTQQGTVDWHQGGQGLLTVQATDPATGCQAQDTMRVQIHATPDVSLTGKEEVCPFEDGVFYMAQTNSSLDFHWSISNGNITSGNGTSQVQARWNGSGRGQLGLYVVNPSTGCDTSLAKDVRVLSTAAIAPQDTAGCPPMEVNFKGLGDSSTQRYVWNFGEGTHANVQNPTFTYTNSGSYKVMLITQSTAGCSDTAWSNVLVHPAPKAAFSIKYPYGRDFLYALDDSLRLQNWSTGGEFYQWEFGDSAFSWMMEPTHMYGDLGVYMVQLVAENNWGCTDTVMQPVRVMVKSNLLVPNVFSPDENDINDQFFVVSQELAEFNIQIYNRWGEKVFESDDQYFRWDGKYKDQYVMQGVYVYTIKAEDRNGEPLDKHGTITVLHQ